MHAVTLFICPSLAVFLLRILSEKHAIDLWMECKAVFSWGGEHGSCGERPLRGGGCGRGVWEGDVPPPAWSAKLKLPPFYEVNGKVYCNTIKTLNDGYRFSAKEILCLTCLQFKISSTDGIYVLFIICTCSCCAALSMELWGRLPPCPPINTALECPPVHSLASSYSLLY
jgi:hypothetical protein